VGPSGTEQGKGVALESKASVHSSLRTVTIPLARKADLSASPRRDKRSRVNASASEQRRGTLQASRDTGRTQRSPSQRIDEPRRQLSAATVISKTKINPLLSFVFVPNRSRHFRVTPRDKQWLCLTEVDTSGSHRGTRG